MAKRELHPRLKLLGEDDQKKALEELENLNKVTGLVWDAVIRAQKAFDQLEKSEIAFVIEKERRLQRLLDEANQGIEETILILGANPFPPVKVD